VNQVTPLSSRIPSGARLRAGRTETVEQECAPRVSIAQRPLDHRMAKALVEKHGGEVPVARDARGLPAWAQDGQCDPGTRSASKRSRSTPTCSRLSAVALRARTIRRDPRSARECCGRELTLTTHLIQAHGRRCFARKPLCQVSRANAVPCRKTKIVRPRSLTAHALLRVWRCVFPVWTPT